MIQHFCANTPVAENVLRQVEKKQLYTQLSICLLILIFIQTLAGLSLESFLQGAQQTSSATMSIHVLD